jgi:predicted GNAT family N-acyltransferase
MMTTKSENSEHESITLLRLHWEQAESLAKPIRRSVFIEEQQVDEFEEWDDEDKSALHIIVLKNQRAIATARLTQKGKIGRMSVLKAYRQQGIGSMMLLELIAVAHVKGLKIITLWAQTHAKGFYHKHGFVEHGEEFIDAGILHIKMVYEH